MHVHTLKLGRGTHVEGREVGGLQDRREQIDAVG
jgi:hypothetical protein